MLDALLVFILVILIFKFVKSFSHPKNFPPGPKYPLPVIGHGYLLSKKLNESLLSLASKYGKIYGMWLFGKRAIIISDFEVLQNVMNKNETSNREMNSITGKQMPSIENKKRVSTLFLIALF